MAEERVAPDEFDFDRHRGAAIEGYRQVQPLYLSLAEVAQRILKDTLDGADIRVHSVEARVKSLESFANKACKPSEAEPNRPKYPDPVHEITDLAGVRVITFLPSVVTTVCEHIEREFTVLEKTDKSAELMDEGRFGYQSVHYIAQMSEQRDRLAEYQRFRGLKFEIQVRTILQHAWAELEHDIQYKTATVIPATIRRRFVALAGLLEMADREFEALQRDDETLRREARHSVEIGNLAGVEITPDALRSYLDRRLGADGRVSNWSYGLLANHLRKLGFQTLSQVDACIRGYDDDRVSRAVYGTRHGQITRTELTVLASMGQNYIARHPWGKPGPDGAAPEYDWVAAWNRYLGRIRDAGIEIGSFDPQQHHG